MNRAYWDKIWAEPDEQIHGWMRQDVREQVREAVESGWFHPGCSVLDIGCGNGNSAAWLAKSGFEVLGMDFSEKAIVLARQLNNGARDLEFICADVTEPGNLNRKFDLLVDCGCLHSLPKENWETYSRNLGFWARTGSRFLLMMRYGPPIFESETWEGRIAQVQKLLSRDFEMIEAKKTNMERPDSEISRPGVVFRLLRK